MMRPCPSCGTVNRAPARHLADRGRCGSCKAPLPPADAPIPVRSAEFDDVIRELRVPAIVDFWASWCGPCRMAAPELDALAREMAGRAVILKVDIDANPELAARYRVQSVPTFLVFRDGAPVFAQSGVAPRSTMKSWLEQAGVRAA